MILTYFTCSLKIRLRCTKKTPSGKTQIRNYEENVLICSRQDIDKILKVDL